jgi:hypothetical protein
MAAYEIPVHEIAGIRVIQLFVNDKNVICIPIEMLAVRTFSRSILAPDHPEKLVHDVILNITSEFKSKVTVSIDGFFQANKLNPKFTLYLGKYLTKDITCKYCLGINHSFEEKETDVRIATFQRM